tara:strand:+ start:4663 stop:5184 length:522 start_codon:yes stop_codon:yes gene_type:complete
MQAILLYFWRLCLLRESPERIPPNVGIALAATIFYLLVGMLSFSVNKPQLSFLTTVGVSSLSIVIEGSALFGLLIFKQFRNRYLSTITAIFSCNGLLLTLLLPVNLMLKGMEAGLLLDFINALSLISLFWWLAIVGFILRKSAQISLFQGIVLAFVIELLVAISIRGLFDQFS